MGSNTRHGEKLELFSYNNLSFMTVTLLPMPIAQLSWKEKWLKNLHEQLNIAHKSEIKLNAIVLKLWPL